MQLKHIDTSNTFIKGIFGLLRLIYRGIRSFRFNRNFLVFLVFLAISTVLWFMQTYQETLTATLYYKVNLVGVPKNYIRTSELPESIRVVVSAHGSNYYRYLFGNDVSQVDVDFDDLDCTSSEMDISSTVLKRTIAKQLGSDFRIISVAPSQLAVYYTSGHAKKLPIVLDGNIIPGTQRVISNVIITPDSAQVYLPLSIYDSVKAVHTESQSLRHVVDTTSFRIALRKIDKTKIAPDSVDVRIIVDLQTETSLTVPVYSLNCPRNKVVRTFPGKVEVTFRTIASQLNKTKPDDFLLAVDYNKIKSSDKYCKVELVAKPDYATNVRFSPRQVQFVMEQQME